MTVLHAKKKATACDGDKSTAGGLDQLFKKLGEAPAKAGKNLVASAK